MTTDHDFGPEAMEPGRAYWVTYECRDIGYGVERGHAEFTYRDPASWGKHQFDPAGGGEPIYLFSDEIKDAY